MLKSYMSGISYYFGVLLLMLSNVSTLSLSLSLASASSLSTSTSTTSSASSSSTTIQVVEPLEKPKNDCKAVSPQYTIKSLDGKEINATFDVSCDTGFYGGDIFNCSGFAYWAGTNQGVNCWLKPGGYMAVASREVNATYAKLVL